MKPEAAMDGEAANPGSVPVIRAALLGRGIQQSRTPRMHEAEGARLGLRYEYQLFDFDHLGLSDSELPTVIEKARLEGYAGLNITHPFKERVIGCLDRLSPDAKSIGAVNTVVFDANGAVGHNTDCWGFAESMRRGLSNARLDSVVLFGAGGAGMAVATALLELGARLVAIADIDSAKVARLVLSLGARFGAERVAGVSDAKAAIEQADGLVNATPVGMAKYPGMPVEPEWLRPNLWVADIIYFPAETQLLIAAKRLTCRVLPGTGMAILQAVKAFKVITGADPDPEQMARHFGK